MLHLLIPSSLHAKLKDVHELKYFALLLDNEHCNQLFWVPTMTVELEKKKASA